MTATLHLIAESFDCISIMVPHFAVPKFRRFKSKKTIRRGTKRETHHDIMDMEKPVLSRKKSKSSSGDSMATTSTCDSSQQSPVSSTMRTNMTTTSLDVTAQNEQAEESLVQLCFLPRCISSSLSALLTLHAEEEEEEEEEDELVPPTESFYFLPMENKFADFEESSDQEEFGHFIDFD